MASYENVNLVDLEKAISVSMLGPDGTHLTSQGYTVMAETFFNAIVATLEVRAPALSQSLQPVRAIR